MLRKYLPDFLKALEQVPHFLPLTCQIHQTLTL